jgi:hypothetical protein
MKKIEVKKQVWDHVMSNVWLKVYQKVDHKVENPLWWEIRDQLDQLNGLTSLQVREQSWKKIRMQIIDENLIAKLNWGLL